MTILINNAFYVFFVVLEIILFLYILTSWFRMNGKIKNILFTLIEPVLTPVRYMLKHSIFNSPTADLSPIISFIIIVFLQDFFSR
ncbi:MAG: YggT family protein [Anaerocolumna sp.]